MEKSAISRQNPCFGTSSESGYRYLWSKAKWYRYPSIERVGTGSNQSGIGTNQSGTGTNASNNPDFCIYAFISPKFVLR